MMIDRMALIDKNDKKLLNLYYGFSHQELEEALGKPDRIITGGSFKNNPNCKYQKCNYCDEGECTREEVEHMWEYYNSSKTKL